MADGTGRYLQNIGRVALLKGDEEIELGRAVKEWQDSPEPSKATQAKGKRGDAPTPTLRVWFGHLSPFKDIKIFLRDTPNVSLYGVL